MSATQRQNLAFDSIHPLLHALLNHYFGISVCATDIYASTSSSTASTASAQSGPRLIPGRGGIPRQLPPRWDAAKHWAGRHFDEPFGVALIFMLFRLILTTFTTRLRFNGGKLWCTDFCYVLRVPCRHLVSFLLSTSIFFVPLLVLVIFSEFWKQTHDNELYRAYDQVLVDI